MLVFADGRWSPTRRSSPAREALAKQVSRHSWAVARGPISPSSTAPRAARSHGRGQLHPQSPGARLRQRLDDGDAGGSARDRAQRARIVGDRPLVVGPITLRPRFNPNATGPNRNRPQVSCHHRSIIASHRSSPPAGLPGASTRSATPVWMADLLRNHRLERAHRAARSPVARRRVPLVAGDGVPRLSRAGRCRRFPGRADSAGHAERRVARPGAGAARRRPVRVILANMTDETLSVSLEIPGRAPRRAPPRRSNGLSRGRRSGRSAFGGTDRRDEWDSERRPAAVWVGDRRYESAAA